MADSELEHHSSESVDAIDEAGDVEAPAAKKIISAIPPPSHEDKTRKVLAYGSMLILGVLAVGGLSGWLFGDLTTDEVQSFSVILSPIVALLGPILGFYFSRTGERN